MDRATTAAIVAHADANPGYLPSALRDEGRGSSGSEDDRLASSLLRKVSLFIAPMSIYGHNY